MKIFSAFFALVILAPVLSFALSNRQSVDVGLWPFDGAVSMPLCLLGLVPLAVGLVFGGFWGWAASVPHRLKARRLHKELGARDRRIDKLQKTTMVQQTPIVPPKPFWSRWS